MENVLKNAQSNDEPIIGSWLAIGHPEVAEMMALLDYEFIVIDREHTPISLETLENVLRAVENTTSSTESLVRVPSSDPTELKRTLDLDPAGIMVPMVETASEAESIVEATRFPPNGRRGIGIHRAANYSLDLDAYVETAGEDVSRYVQIETERGLRNVDAIAAVDGIDGLFIGPADLSASLGAFGTVNDSTFTDAVDRIVQSARNADISVGTLAISESERETRLNWDIDFLVAGVDSVHLLSGSKDALRHCRRVSKSVE
ncbi:HpcH/HpaI aldolase family protein [Haladaptatus sp. DFWS20]|uniref:HpcH/HpaI aldolase family protein n=1 Tax=Haladaptatus sp. DFWS20 TaxID=3403467 RepID=UPI003EB6A49D